MRGEYDKDACWLVEFKNGVFVLQNSLPFLGFSSVFLRYCTRSGHRILSGILTLGIPEGIRNALNDIKSGRHYADDFKLWQYVELLSSNQNN